MLSWLHPDPYRGVSQGHIAPDAGPQVPLSCVVLQRPCSSRLLHPLPLPMSVCHPTHRSTVCVSRRPIPDWPGVCPWGDCLAVWAHHLHGHNTDIKEKSKWK